MIYTFICAAALAVSVTASFALFSREGLAEKTIFGIIWYFMSHIFVSFFLFVFDAYTMDKAAIGSLILDAVLLAVGLFFFHMGKTDKKKKTSISELLIPLLICAIVVPLSLFKNEFFGMGQDAGVYQVQAIGFIYGHNNVFQSLDEYDLLTDEVQKSEYINMFIQKRSIGLDTPTSISGEKYADGGRIYGEDAPLNAGYMHGIPCFSALLAMAGRIFGLSHMTDINTVFIVCLIYLGFFICKKIKLKTSSGVIAGILIGFSPQIIWNAESSLTETFLTVLMLLIVYFMLSEKRQCLSLIPILCFACYHLTYYTVLPLFLLLFFMLFFITNKKCYAIVAVLLICTYPVFASAIYHIQPVYTIKNYSVIMNGAITENNFHKVIFTASVIILVLFCLAAAVVLIAKHKNEKTVLLICDLLKKPFFIRICAAFIIAVIIIRSFISHESDLVHVNATPTLKGFWLNTGILVMPAAFVYTIVFPDRLEKNRSLLLLCVLFLYCIIFHGLFLRPELHFYYYYGRYFGPFIPISVLFVVMLLDTCDVRIKGLLTAIGLIVLAPDEIFLISEKDDTYCKWEVIETLSEAIDRNDMVYICDDDRIQWMLPLPIKYMTDAKVIPETDFISVETAEDLSEGRTLIISQKRIKDESLKLVLFKNSECSYCYDDGAENNKLIHFPMKCEKNNLIFFLYEKLPDKR